VDKQGLANTIIKALRLDVEGKYRSTTIVGHSGGADVGLFAMEQVSQTAIRRLALLDPAMQAGKLGYSDMFNKLDNLFNSGVKTMLLYGPSPEEFLNEAIKRPYSENVDADHLTYYNDPQVLRKTREFIRE